MKKIIAILLALALFASCKPKYDYEGTITYKVYYPENTVTKTYTGDGNKDVSYSLSSYRGSNDLYFKFKKGAYATIESTTAPIEVVSFTKEKKEDERTED